MEYKKSIFFAEPTVADMRRRIVIPGLRYASATTTATEIAQIDGRMHSYVITSDFFEDIYKLKYPSKSNRRHFPITELPNQCAAPIELLREALQHESRHAGGYCFRSQIDGRLRVVPYWTLARGEKLFAWEMHNGSVDAKLDDSPFYPRIKGSKLHLTVASMTEGKPRKAVSLEGVPVHRRANWRNLRGDTVDCEDNLFRGLGHYTGADWDIFCPHEIAAYWLSLVHLKRDHDIVVSQMRNPLLPVSQEAADMYRNLEWTHRELKVGKRTIRRRLHEPEKTVLMGVRLKQVGIERFFSNEGILADRNWKE